MIPDDPSAGPAGAADCDSAAEEMAGARKPLPVGIGSGVRLLKNSFFADLGPSRAAERCDEIRRHEQVRIERIVSLGQASAAGFWYQQETHEWVMVLRGGAGLELEGGEIVAMGPGDYVDIPAHCRHRVAWTADDEPTVWLAVHYGRSPELEEAS